MKRYIILGLLVWVPLGITIWVLHFLVTTLDQTLYLFPEGLRPDTLLGMHIPGFGVLLKLKHEGGLETWYGHLSGFPDGVGMGASVKQGQFVALSGNVGFSTGPHLHYEVHKDGVAVDPKDFLDVQGAMGGAGAQTLEGPVLTAFLTFKDEIDIIRRSQT